VVPVQVQHQSLALYMLQRLYAWLAGLGLAVAAAVKPKTRSEGQGQHDVVLKHAGHLCSGPFLCEGFLTGELKVRQVGVDGRAFRSAWEKAKAKNEEPLASVLQVSGSSFGAAVLIMIGICDEAALTAPKPPLMVKAP
jgi:hypothetical protein